ncbi:hydroxymethylpyrimidine ABC transporter, substrate-binding component [Sporolactobacillus inulinus]|uniref:Hydroxymethylpyrimidine ABC transporter, substrate-binding component n=1 Tax=Sporolactobacillus inulinus TaxID=2078 RepID=A0A4Y1Z767_9BACL|nr:ABC transporter substrate-binding protein [Sporolactobacillus inulinus]GAY74892.1 hydroxymethylpyrimidine ABC transporter, substrate-binding component [Sporolactobacillus inulinus]
MKRLKWTVSLLLLAALVLSGCASQGSKQKTKNLVIAEPVHLIAYLPLYVAIDKGYFKEEGLNVKAVTATGGAHVTSVVSGDAWGVIGGPESNQIANYKSKDPITSVVNVVNRANVYLMANKKLKLHGNSDEDLANFMKGKTIAAGRYGGSPNLLTRYLLMKVGLNPNKDVKLDEPADAAAVVSLVSQGKADMANGGEPQINEGIKKALGTNRSSDSRVWATTLIRSSVSKHRPSKRTLKPFKSLSTQCLKG